MSEGWTCLCVADVHDASGQLANSVKGQHCLIAQEEASDIVVLKHELGQLFSFGLHCQTWCVWVLASHPYTMRHR